MLEYGIAPGLRSMLPTSALLEASGTISVSIRSGPPGYLFWLRHEEYFLQVGVGDGHFYIRRNQEVAAMPLSLGQDGTCRVWAAWEPERLMAAVNGVAQEVRTAFTVPPLQLIDLARRDNLIPVELYEDSLKFRHTVLTAISSMQDRIAATNSWPSFWNTVYNGASIARREPKREPEIHKALHAHLFDIGIQKNLLIMPEAQAAGGAMDFLVAGTLAGGRRSEVCVEFKCAHASDLQHGLDVQLPAYMKSRGCDYGIYGVLDFRGQYFSEPNPAPWDPLFEGVSHSSAYGGKITICFLHLSPPPPPSKR